MKSLHRGVLIFAVVMSFPNVALAQAEYAIDMGSFTLGGEASLSSYGGELYGDERTRTIRIAPDVMYFVVPHLAVGGALALTSTSRGGSSSTTFGIGPAVGVWFGKPDDRLFPFVLANIILREHQYDVYSSTMTTYQVSAGIDLMLAKNIALMTKLSYLREFYSSEYDENVRNESGNQIVFGVGFRAFAY